MSENSHESFSLPDDIRDESYIDGMNRALEKHFAMRRRILTGAMCLIVAAARSTPAVKGILKTLEASEANDPQESLLAAAAPGLTIHLNNGGSVPNAGILRGIFHIHDSTGSMKSYENPFILDTQDALVYCPASYKAVAPTPPSSSNIPLFGRVSGTLVASNPNMIPNKAIYLQEVGDDKKIHITLHHIAPGDTYTLASADQDTSCLYPLATLSMATEVSVPRNKNDMVLIAKNAYGDVMLDAQQNPINPGQYIPPAP